MMLIISLRTTLICAAIIVSILANSALYAQSINTDTLKGVALPFDVTPNRANPSGTLIRLNGDFTDNTIQAVKTAAGPIARDYDGIVVGSYVLSLNSDGNSYKGALKLAQWVRDYHVSTLIEKGAKCFSACAFVFMAGNRSQEDQYIPSRIMEVGAQLGFHAPFNDAGRGTEREGIDAVLDLENVLGQAMPSALRLHALKAEAYQQI
jgi:hypothetical protein